MSTPFARSCKKILVTSGTERPSATSSSARAKIWAVVSSMAISPPCNTSTRSAYFAISSIEWLTSTIVAPVCLWYSFTWLKIISRPSGSRPAAGSSSTSTSGRMASTPAMAARRFCPPESSNGERSSISGERPQKRAASSTRWVISSSGRPMLRGPNEMSLRTVSSNS
ncbi:hypothetical protein SDC9_189686 [bioreactor metagenome]|uniref:Uncharacterized protein n=1 Tax=bioreactor metagenome TaxID=1076179 RepID=A0A645HTE6_9ZZZZ